MQKNIACIFSLVVLFNAAAYGIDNAALKTSKELVAKVFYGAHDLCIHGYHKSGELIRKAPLGGTVLDNYKISLAVLGMSYVAFEYGYTKYYKKHTPILKIFAGLFDYCTTKLGCPSLENLVCCKKQAVQNSSLTVRSADAQASVQGTTTVDAGTDEKIHNNSEDVDVAAAGLTTTESMTK